ncbi:hypothetical protein BH10ACT2_BH10ACT2_06680 [soil metagenome]
MNTRTIRLALVVLVLAASCSDSGDGNGGGGGSATDPTGDTPTTVEGKAAVPAGVNWAASSFAPPLEAGATAPTFDEVTATAGVPSPPFGFPFRQSDYLSKLFVLGDVQLATGSCSCWEGGNSSGVFGGLRTPVYLFRSVDAGATWTQVDILNVLGDVNGRINDIVERDGTFVMTATTSDAAGTSPTVINVLRSTDGAGWELVSTIAGEVGPAEPLQAFSLYTLGSSLVLYGADLPCDFGGSSAIQSIGTAYQTRIWTSTDGGASWLAQSPADTGLDSNRPPLPDAAACAGLGIQDILDTYASSPRLISLVDDRLAVWSADGQRIVSSGDGTTWSSATLEGPVALPSDRVESPEANSTASAIVAIDGELVAMNLEDYRNIDDTASGSTVGLSVIAWTSIDGATWQRQPVGRPIIASNDYSASYQFLVTDGRLALRVFNRADSIELGMYESVAGVAEDWTKCAAVAGGNCSFSDELVDFAPGADLAGINLEFASLAGLDLTDVSLAGALLTSTDMTGTTVERTNFDGAVLKYINLTGDLATSTFVGATLTSVVLSPQFFVVGLAGATVETPRISFTDAGLPAGVSLVGRDFTHYEFTNGSLAGVDFSGANLTGASFSFTDLTGAIFTGATLDGAFFYEVTCPDGQPSDDAATNQARCRL